MATTEQIRQLMKRCQVGVGGRNALADAHDILAECYGALGALVSERDQLRVMYETSHASRLHAEAVVERMEHDALHATSNVGVNARRRAKRVRLE